jgi:peptidoglycan biosynthesis protein MviN/MurJ (putative lipid II flippase)
MTTTATNALTARPRRRAPVWISIVNTCTAAVALWFYALPSGSTYLVVLYALLLVVSAVTVWALVSNRPRLGQTLLGATVLLALPAVAIWVTVLAFIALAIQVRTGRPRRSG